jgi:hypothetical protein
MQHPDPAARARSTIRAGRRPRFAVLASAPLRALRALRGKMPASHAATGFARAFAGARHRRQLPRVEILDYPQQRLQQAHQRRQQHAPRALPRPARRQLGAHLPQQIAAAVAE